MEGEGGICPPPQIYSPIEPPIGYVRALARFGRNLANVQRAKKE